MPERQRLEFLRLLDIGLRPARPARGLAVLAPADPATARAVPVPIGTPVDGPVPFETTGDITAQPFEGRAFIKRKASDGERAATARAAPGPRHPLRHRSRRALCHDAPVRRRAATKRRASIRSPRASTRRSGWRSWRRLLEAREAALAALDDQPALLNVGFVPRLAPADPEAPPPDLADLWQWDATTRPRRPGDPLGFTALEVEQDRTGGLARPGTLRLLLPPREAVFAPADDVRADFRAGVGPRPPRLDDPDLQARLLFWLRLRPAGGGDALPLAWLGINAVEIDQRRTLRDMVVGTGAGFAAQEVALPGPLGRPGEPGPRGRGIRPGFVRWPLVPDLAALSPDARGFELDAEAGIVALR